MNSDLLHRRPVKRGHPNTCPVCNDDFVGRRNRIFCSLECKNRHHYDLNADIRANERSIAKILLSNVRVLYRLFKRHPDKTRLKISMKGLGEFGFDFEGPMIEITTKEGTFYKVGDYAYQIDVHKQHIVIQKL